MNKLVFWLLRQLRPGRVVYRLMPATAQSSITQTRKRIAMQNLHITGAATGGDMRGKIVAYIFAGRRDRMEILLGYLDELLAKKQIDAMHVWNLARTDGDREWVRGLAGKDGYSVMEFAVGDWLKIYKSKLSPANIAESLWPEAHNFYAQSCYDGCGLLKVDDDVVFVDAPRFGVFRAALLRLANGECGNCHMISANVVNNMTCDYWRHRYGVIPADVAEFDAPHMRGITPKQAEDYYHRGKKSQAVHEFFLKNPERFLREKGENINLKPGSGFSINFVGITNAVLPMPAPCQDEGYLAYGLPPEKSKGITIIRGFTVAHLSFTVQPEQNDAELIPKYRELQKRAPLIPQTGE